MVISLQNGVGNADILRNRLPQHRVVAGMVGFNIVQLGEGRFHRGSEGSLAVPTTGELGQLLAAEGLDCAEYADMTPVLWGKLLLNLNNALNALSGLPLLEQLQDRAWRVLLATMMDEALAAMSAAHIRPVKLTHAPAWLLPYVLRLPNILYKRIAASMLKIDPQARSSMWEDLQQGRVTEVDYLQGAVLALAHRHRLDALLCARVLKAVKAAEVAKSGSPHLQPAQLV
jgi:2-dehydropantoate 2-reductase